jgi:hypothetical protein
MRPVIVAIIALLILTPRGSRAEDCATALKDTDSYAELNKMMACLNGKIKRLESEMQAIEKARSVPVGAPASDPVGDPGLLHTNPYFSVYKGNFSKNGPTASFSLSIQNKTDKEIYLAWEANTPILTDENGLSTARLQSTMPAVNRGDPRQVVYAVIGPGAVKPVSMTFIDDRIKGNTLTLGTNIVQLDGDKHYYHSISWRATSAAK